MKFTRVLPLFAGIALASRVLANTSWTFTPLPNISSDIHATVWASGINSAGVVAGNIVDATGSHPCIWVNGQPENIGPTNLEDVSLPSINDAGQVAGYWLQETGSNGIFLSSTAGFIYDSGSLTLLQNAGNATFWPAAINNVGIVAGVLPYNDDAATYNIATGAFTDFGQFGAQAARFTAINNNGLLAGTVDFAGFSNIQAFVLYDGQKQTLTGLNGVGTTPNAINDSGVIVGTATNLNGKQQAVSWIENGQQSTLLPLAVIPLPLLPDATASAATDINAAGDIVGWMQIGSDPGDVAVLWIGDQVIDLNTLLPVDSGWVLNEATGINDSGQIVGEGTYDGEQLPFLLTPTGITSIPEPAGIPLAAVFCLLATRRRE